MILAEQGGLQLLPILPTVASLTTLAFTIAAFWALNFRRGTLWAGDPIQFGIGAGNNGIDMRFPLAIYNTGAATILVDDLRLVTEGVAIQWRGVKRTLGERDHDQIDVPSPFAVEGRRSESFVAQFQVELADWSPRRSSGVRW